MNHKSRALGTPGKAVGYFMSLFGMVVRLIGLAQSHPEQQNTHEIKRSRSYRDTALKNTTQITHMLGQFFVGTVICPWWGTGRQKVPSIIFGRSDHRGL